MEKESLLLSVDLFDGNSIGVKTCQGLEEENNAEKDPVACKDGRRVFLTSHGSCITKMILSTSDPKHFQLVSITSESPLRTDCYNCSLNKTKKKKKKHRKSLGALLLLKMLPWMLQF